MTLSDLIASLQKHGALFPLERNSCLQTISWIEKYNDFAFVKDNLEGHLTASMLIVNPERTRVLLMLHKKFQRWQQFGGHCDGEIDVRNVAIREFHEESGITVEPKLIGDIFFTDVHRISIDAKGRPAHYHFDVIYLGELDESTAFSRQIEEVDDIRWFDIEGIEEHVEEEIVRRVSKINTLGK